MQSAPFSRSVRGSTLVMVTLVAVCVSLIVGSLLSYALVEARINRANVLRLEAKNAAEAALEYGAAELAVRFQANRNFDSTSLVSNPVSTHSTRFATLFAAAADAPTSVVPGSVRLHVSNTSSILTRRIDAKDPENAFDPLRGQTVNSRYVRLLATATARAGGRDHAAYASQAFEVRDSQLFNYAIFYNLPMEFHPSPAMEVWGPVHSNEDVYLTAGNSVHYFDTFTTAGRMLAEAISTTGRPSGRSIHFTTGEDSNKDGKPDTIGINGHNFTVGKNTVTTHVDSLLSSRAAGHTFADAASQLWRGNAQDVSLGVERQNPPGVLSPADARRLIEPPDFSTSANLSIEEQKFSRKAGLYIVVDKAGTAPRVSVFSNAADARAFKNAANRSNWLTANPGKVITEPKDSIKSTRRLRDQREDKTINLIDIDLGKMRTALRTTASSPADDKFRFKNGTDWDYKNGWTGAIYVEVENPNAGFTTTSDIGAVSGGDSSKVHGAGTGTGTATAVRLLNGQQLPSLAPTTTHPNPEHGFTFATNAPVYVAGHFNANGNFGTATSPDGSERSPDPGYQNGTPDKLDNHTEVPALVAGDAINILSAAWLNATGNPVGDGRENNLDGKGRIAADTEISAVFMGGIVNTPAGGAGYSGGVENYPRFHEKWDGKTMRYRGSIVALFNSAHGTGAWPKALYGAPTRKWGFHDFLKDGKYPPFTPTLRTYRRIDYRDITKTEYEALLADNANGFRQM